MKTNAIIRIVLFSLGIVLLSGILLAGLGLQNFTARIRGEEIQVTEAPILLANENTIDAEKVHSLDITWAAGSITIAPDSQATSITFQEYGEIAPGDELVWTLRNGTLDIQFQEDSFSIGISQAGLSKDLVITVPAGWSCSSLEIDAAAAQVIVKDLCIREVDFDGASGICQFLNCDVQEMDVDTASGDITFEGLLNSLEISAMSADCRILLGSIPRQIDLETLSGDLELTLPHDCGFTLVMNAMSGDFTTDFETVSSHDRHTHGDGHCRINIEAMSGDVAIYKGISFDCVLPGCDSEAHHHR